MIDDYQDLCRAEDGTQTRDPQLGRLMLYQLSYFRKFGGQRWIRTTEGVSQQIYSLPHLATLVFAHFFASLSSVIISFPESDAKVQLFFQFANKIEHFYCGNSTFVAFVP